MFYENCTLNLEVLYFTTRLWLYQLKVITVKHWLELGKNDYTQPKAMYELPKKPQS